MAGQWIVLTNDPLQGGMECPGLQQGATYRKLLVTEQRLDHGSAHQLLQELARHLLVQSRSLF